MLLPLSMPGPAWCRSTQVGLDSGCVSKAFVWSPGARPQCAESVKLADRGSEFRPHDSRATAVMGPTRQASARATIRRRYFRVIVSAYAATSLCILSGFVGTTMMEEGDVLMSGMGYEAAIVSSRISTYMPAGAKQVHRTKHMLSISLDEHAPDMRYSIHLPIAEVHVERARVMRAPAGSFCRISLSIDLYSDTVMDSRSEVMYVASGRPVFQQRWTLQADGTLKRSSTQAWNYSEDGLSEKLRDGDGDLLVSGASDSLSRFQYVDGLLDELVQLRPTGRGGFNSEVIQQLKYRNETLVLRDVLMSSAFSRPVASYVYEYDASTIVSMVEYGDVEHHELILAEEYRWEGNRLTEIQHERVGDVAISKFEYDEEGRRSVHYETVSDKTIIKQRWFYGHEGDVYPTRVQRYGASAGLTDAISYAYDPRGRVIGQVAEHLGAWTHSKTVAYSPECDSVSELEVGWPCFNPVHCSRLDPLSFWP